MAKRLGLSNWWAISLLVLAAALSTYVVIVRVINVLPKILGDELTYSMDARHSDPSHAAVPNYLFNLLFSTTSACGYGFYTCSKVINLVMLFGIALVVYFTAKLFANTSVAVWIAFLTLLGPISSYVSYFTPDIMFFLAASLVILMLIKLDQDSQWWRWALIGAGVGVSTLIKPHGLFLVGAVVLYIGYLAYRRTSTNLIWGLIGAASFMIALVATKLGLGYLFAGSRGLVLFGGSYDVSAGKVLTGSSATTSGSIPIPQGQTASPWSFSNPIWVGPTAFSIFLHIAFLLIFFAVPVAAIFTGRDKGAQSAKTELPEVYRRARFVIVASLLSLLAVSSVYVVISQAWGEVLTNRVMVRYYEFAVIFIPILLTPFLTRPSKYSLAAKWAIGVGVFCIALFASPLFQNNVQVLYADSSLIAASIQSGVGLVAISLVGFAVLIFWFSKPIQGAKLWLYAFAPLVILIFNVSSYINMTIPSSFVGKYTQSSQWVHNNLNDEQKNGLIVYGAVKSNVQAAQLWIDDPTVTGQAVPPNGQVNLQGVESGKYVLVVGGIPVVGDSTTIKKTPYWIVLKVGKSSN